MPGALTALLCPKKKNGLQIMSLAAYASETKKGAAGLHDFYLKPKCPFFKQHSFSIVLFVW